MKIVFSSGDLFLFQVRDCGDHFKSGRAKKSYQYKGSRFTIYLAFEWHLEP